MSNSRARGAVNYPEVEEKLLSLIRAKTPRLIKPNLSALGPVTVVATVKQIIGLNERKGTWKAKISFRVNYAFNLSAYESPLLWSLEDFGGIECLMVPEDTFWYPSLSAIKYFLFQYDQILNKLFLANFSNFYWNIVAESFFKNRTIIQSISLLILSPGAASQCE